MRPPVLAQPCLRRLPAILPLLAALGLAACSGPGVYPLPQDPYGGVGTVAPVGAILQLPPDLADLRLMTRRSVVKGMVVEEVVLANDTAIPRENLIVTRTRWRGSGAYLPSMELPNPFKQSEIEQHFLQQFPGAPLDQVTRERRNGRGVHRYLIADLGDAGSCIYAWQFFDAPTETRGGLHSFAVDLRYCQPTHDLAAALDLFDRMATVAPL
ncbi:cellulose biosynthesis protein BcsN [Geminicoccus harenae]|uniref:cellulose biosynthesis protein BcsN n=1 Tax=Geminicoccus harenae TaxID=2498453 RepID=UPI00168BB5D9|nr:cellulose biosynthesis protein BcsN [Geminicoccus harenae]